ncbi:hypothetical protein [Stenotrophomonas maltophilia]|uniref:hypothetical protein n=1 Tax=Stenotrophomonas maltophilia TaxID=40324 RepID=UPI001F53A7AE|nr:hypothetical protein [Stenotrophomonas maltophilia]
MEITRIGNGLYKATLDDKNVFLVLGISSAQGKKEIIAAANRVAQPAATQLKIQDDWTLGVLKPAKAAAIQRELREAFDGNPDQSIVAILCQDLSIHRAAIRLIESGQSI